MNLSDKAALNTVAAVQQAEARLCEAQLTGDTATLNQLLTDDLLFVGPDGSVYTKAMDLDVHRSGTLRLTALLPRDLTIRLLPEQAVTSVVVELQGFFGGAPMSGRFRYLRVWTNRDGHWQVLAGSCTPIAG